MNNIIVPKERFTAIKSELRSAGITYRDCWDTVIVPKFGEAFSVDASCRDGMSPGEAAYQVLSKSSIAVGKPFMWSSSEMSLLTWRPPFWYDPRYSQQTGWMGYIDIRSSYYQIYRHLSWEGVMPGKDDAFPIGDEFDSLKNWKQARNAIVGIARSTREKWVTGNEVTYKQKDPNPFLSPYLWGMIQGFLNAVADQMLKMGSVYICVDGYVFVGQDDFDNATEYLSRKGVVTKSTTDKDGRIWGWNSIAIGDKVSKQYRTSSKPITAIDSPDYEVLRYVSERMMKDNDRQDRF